MSYARYLVPCLTEEKTLISDYVNEKPGVCPTNVEHKINSEAIRVLDVMPAPKPIFIDQSSGLITSGKQRTDCYTVNDTQGVIKIVYPYNVSIHSVTFLPDTNSIGTQVELSIEGKQILVQGLMIFNITPITFGLSRLSSTPLVQGEALLCKMRGGKGNLQFYIEIEY